ncbi:MAG: Gfo/Idh/MocA family oxidoreductase, partial [Planctomycetia bacterium]
MAKTHSPNPSGNTRRDFLKTTGLIAGTVAVGSLATPAVHAAEKNTIKIALVGAGGRGTGAAAQALATSGPTKLWAVADVFGDQVQKSINRLSKKRAKQVDVPKERQFVGFDGYKKAIDSLDKGDVVLLTTPPAFRPMHLEYAVKKGINVFMEKSFAVDGPGVRRVLAAGKEAEKKSLKIAGGLMCRHYQPLEMAIEKVHN